MARDLMMEAAQQYLDEMDSIMPMKDGSVVSQQHVCEILNDFFLYVNDGKELERPLLV